MLLQLTSNKRTSLKIPCYIVKLLVLKSDTTFEYKLNVTVLSM